MRQGEAAFVDSGAWIALALTRDPLHGKAREQWQALRGAGARLHTSVPVVIETFTFLDRNANRDVALAWRQSVAEPDLVEILPCELSDLDQAWDHRSPRRPAQAVGGRRHELCDHETALRIGLAWTFDHHFAIAGFRLA